MNLKDALELAGVDYEMTLNRFSNNAMLLERFVKKFPGDKTFQELDAAVGDKRFGDVERAAHTLKGIAANLGFQYLSDLSAEVVNLVRSLRQGQYWNCLFQSGRRIRKSCFLCKPFRLVECSDG